MDLDYYSHTEFCLISSDSFEQELVLSSVSRRSVYTGYLHRMSWPLHIEKVDLSELTAARRKSWTQYVVIVDCSTKKELNSVRNNSWLQHEERVELST